MEDLNPKIKCDKCGSENILSNYVFATSKVCGLEVDYLTCPVCSEKFVFLLKDKKQKAILKQLKALNHRVEVKHRLKKPLSSGLLKQLNQSFRESKDYQAGLRAEYLQAVTEQLNKSDFETNS